VGTGPMDIAIIGLACRFPGAANADRFWENLVAGIETVTTFSDADLLGVGIDPALVRNPDYVKAAPILERAGCERRQPEPDRRRQFTRRNLGRQVRHRNLDHKIDHDLDDQCDQAPDQAIHDIGGMGDGADQWQGEAEQAQAQRDRGCRIVVADQLELVMRRDARIDEEVDHDRKDRGAEIDQERRQPGERLQDHLVGVPDSCNLRFARSLSRRTQVTRSIPKIKTPPFATGSSLGGASLAARDRNLQII